VDGVCVGPAFCVLGRVLRGSSWCQATWVRGDRVNHTARLYARQMGGDDGSGDAATRAGAQGERLWLSLRH
jgi:hypothetical protein